MTEFDKPTPKSGQEYYLDKERRIGELKERLHQQGAAHLNLLQVKGLMDDPRHLLGAHADDDVRASREQHWSTQTELLGLDRDALTTPGPEGLDPKG